MDGFPDIVTDPYVLLFCRMLAAALLMAAGLSKLHDRDGFVAVVRNFRVLPAWMAGVAGHMLPAVEVGVSVALLMGWLLPWSAVVACTLFILFSAAVALNLLRGRSDISCGCFGGRGRRLSWGLVLRNVALAGLAASAAAWPAASEGGGAHTLFETAAMLVMAVAALASWRLWGVIVKYWQPPGLPESPTLSRARK